MMLIRRQKSDAFTLIELLVVISILTLLMCILVPALCKVKKSALSLLSANKQRQVVTANLCYTTDQDEKFPDSVATLGTGTHWSWREPTVLTGFQERSPGIHRSVSEYLKSYLEDSSTLFCSSAPSKYPYAQQAWDAGDNWDNPSPDTSEADPLFGNYCLYWNYIGFLEGKKVPFMGPRSTTQRKYESKLLISDYFGYGHWRNELTYGSREAYGSCERFIRSDITSGTSVACDFWSLFPADEDKLETIELTLNAGYIDGHVEKFHPIDVIPMKVSMKPDGLVPYPDNIGPAGTIYIPQNSW